MASDIKCNNYIGGSPAELEAQMADLEGAGVSIESNPDDQSYCWYVAGEEFIKPIEFNEPYFKMNGLFYPESLLVYFNKGAPREGDIPVSLLKGEGVNRPVEIVEFFTAAERPSEALGCDDDILTVEKTIIRHIEEKWPSAVIIDSDIKIATSSGGHQNYIVYLAGYNLPAGERTSSPAATRPPFDTAHCPEWMSHTKEVKGDIPLDDWAIILRANPPEAGESRSIFAIAIPRNELKNRALDEYSLRSRLGASEYLKGDNPVRLIKDVKFMGADGVAGLYCPAFDVEILEIEKSEDNCLAWVERQESPKAERIGGGYLISRGEGIYKYISATGRLDVERVKGLIFKRAPEQEGFDKSVSSTQVLKDTVCSAYKIEVNYTPQYHQKDDLRGLEQRFQNNETALRKIRGLATLGPVILARPAKDGLKRPDSLINVIKRELHEEIPVKRKEACLVVDQSGSMADDAGNVAIHYGELEAELAASANDAGICLERFVDDEKEILVHLQKGRKLSEYSQAMRDGLLKIAKDPHGGTEYIYEAAKLALDEIEKNGAPGSKRKVLVLTDEKGDLKDKGETLESISKRAKKLGVEFVIVFIPSEPFGLFGSGGGYGSPLRDYLEYLNSKGIEISKMNEGEKISLWEQMLEDRGLSMNGKAEVVKRLSGVSRNNRTRVVNILAEIVRLKFNDDYPYFDKRTVDRPDNFGGRKAVQNYGLFFRFRAKAITALSQFGGHDAEEALLDVPLEESDPSTLYNVIEALNNIGTKSAVSKAKKLLMDNINSCWQSPQDVKIFSKVAKELDENDIERLEERFYSLGQDSPIRYRIIEILGENGSEKALGVLSDILSKFEKGENIRLGSGKTWTALAILKNRYDKSALSIFTKNPSTVYSSPVVTDAFVKIMLRYEDKFSDNELEQFLTVRTDKISCLAALILAKRGDKSAIEYLEVIVVGDELGPKLDFTAAAGLYKDRSAIPWLERLLLGNSVDGITDWRAWVALKEIDDNRARELLATPALANYIKDSSDSALLLAKTDPKGAMAKLFDLCHALHHDTRWGAAEALAEIGDESAIPILSELLNDTNGNVVEAAGKAIEEIQKRSEMQRLERE